jgi:hypothetical protein
MASAKTAGVALVAAMLASCGGASGSDGAEQSAGEQPLAVDEGSREAIVRTFAPHVHLHPDDAYRPANVDWYLARVRMRYHHRGCPDHEVLGLGAVNQTSLIAQEHRDNGSFCRHSDEQIRRSQTSENFFLEVVDPKTYEGAPKNEWRSYAHWQARDDGRVDIRYWLFYPRNDNVAIIDHESDWEQVKVTLDVSTSANPIVVEVSLSQHHGGQQFAAGSPDLVLDEGTHPVVYAAKGSHANYPRPGTYAIKGTAGIAHDEAKAARIDDVWKTEQNFVIIGSRNSPQNGQMFIQYWGHWGELGDLPETDGVVRHFP